MKIILNKYLIILMSLILCLILIYYQVFSLGKSPKYKLLKRLNSTKENIVVELRKEDYGGDSGNHVVIIFNDLNPKIKKELLLANRVKIIDINWINDYILLTIESSKFRVENFWYDPLSNKKYFMIINDLSLDRSK